MQRNQSAVLISVLLAAGVQAEGVHQAGEFYLGGKLGGALYSEPCAAGSTSCDDVSGGLGLVGGYQLNEWLALEGGYDYLGGPLATYPALGQPGSSADYDAVVQGVELGVKADYALNERVLVFGKGGTLLWQVDKEATEPVTGAMDERDSGASLMLGGGVEYRLSPAWSTRLEYQYFNGVGDDATGSSDVHLVSLGLDYRFGGSTVEAVPSSASAPVAPEPMAVKVVEPEPVVAPEPQVIETFTQVVSASSNETLFENNSTQLSPVLKAQLAPVLARLKTYPESEVEITGHTDSVGAASYNQSLSEVRAQNVADYLESEGIARHRMAVKGMGELRPIATNETASGRAHNRRVEIEIPELVMETTLGQ